MTRRIEEPTNYRERAEAESFGRWEKELTRPESQLPVHNPLVRLYLGYRRLKLGIVLLSPVILLAIIYVGYQYTQPVREVIAKPAEAITEALENSFVPRSRPPIIEVLPDPKVPRELSAERKAELGQLMPELRLAPEPLITGFSFPPPETLWQTEAQRTSGQSVSVSPVPPLVVDSVLTEQMRVAGMVEEPNPSWFAKFGNAVEDFNSEKLERRPIGEGSHVEGHATVEFAVTILSVRRTNEDMHFTVTLDSPKAVEANSIFLDDQLEPGDGTVAEFRTLACSNGPELLSLMRRIEESIRLSAPGFMLDIAWEPYGTADAAGLNGTSAFGHCSG